MIYFDNLEFTTDDEYSLYLIEKYLDKYFGENKEAIIDSFSPKEVARLLGEKDISFFSLYYLRATFTPSDDNDARTLCDEHYRIWKVLSDAFIHDCYDKINIVEPRGLAKTTFCDKSLAVWAHCYKKSKFTLLGAKTSDDAEQFLTSIKREFLENELIINEFGKLIDLKGYKPNTKEYYKVNSGEIEFTNNTYIRAVGSATSVRGSTWGGARPTIFIGDDYQSETDILTPEGREKKWNRWCKEVEEVGDTAVYRRGKKIKSATKYVSIGTVLHFDCLISRISRNKEYHTILNRAVLLEGDQTIDGIFASELWVKCKSIYFNDKLENPKGAAKEFYHEHIDEMKYPLLWEEKWDFFDDIAVKYWSNRTSFMSEKMNDASTLGKKWFTSIRLQTKNEIENHAFLKTMLCVDPAGEGSKRSDYLAMVVGSLGENDFKYARKTVLTKLGFKAYCRLVVDLLLEYEDITHVDIEKNTYLGADVIEIQELIEKIPELRKRRIQFINEIQVKNKDDRIYTIVEEINNGQMIIVDECEGFIKQIEEFQGALYSPYDDAPDVLARFSKKITQIENKNVIRMHDRRRLGI